MVVGVADIGFRKRMTKNNCHHRCYYGVLFVLGTVISLSQSRSVRSNPDNVLVLVALWITSSHEACTVGNPCSHGHKGVP
ncbi:hypothetical protein T03_11521 [Trichinella britovi]|uniref:Uncharacterized protein n=1 Tax=Trichinella britovi TaxID=45882 RepID=A0A0V1DHM6_TRIBR|nr:hypothetical protein T03_11521 [Trichinella britovi]